MTIAPELSSRVEKLAKLLPKLALQLREMGFVREAGEILNLLIRLKDPFSKWGIRTVLLKYEHLLALTDTSGALTYISTIKCCLSGLLRYSESFLGVKYSDTFSNVLGCNNLCELLHKVEDALDSINELLKYQEGMDVIDENRGIYIKIKKICNGVVEDLLG